MTAAPRPIEERALDAIRMRTFWRGDSRPAAGTLGISYAHLIKLRNGSARMTARTAQRILERAREEELALAGRIERELNAHWHSGGEAE